VPLTPYYRPPDDTIRTVKESAPNTFGYITRVEIDQIIASMGASGPVYDRLEDLCGAFGVAPLQTRVHEFDENLVVPAAAETTILSYVVPVGQTFEVGSWSAWANVDAEYYLRVNGTQRAGGRTSIAEPSLRVVYLFKAITATAGQTVTISTLRQSPAVLLPFKAELEGVLNG